jgi:hypothetical protein
MTMPQRFDLGRGLLALGGLLLVVALFVPWYSVHSDVPGFVGGTGWQVFESIDLVLAAAGVAAVALAARGRAASTTLAIALPLGVLAVVAVQIVDPPPVVASLTDPATGAWLALGAGLLMAAGSALSLAAVSITVQVRGREVRRRVPAVDHREVAGESGAAGTEGPAAGSSSSLFAEPAGAMTVSDTAGSPTQEFRAIPPELDPDPASPRRPAR